VTAILRARTAPPIAGAALVVLLAQGCVGETPFRPSGNGTATGGAGGSAPGRSGGARGAPATQDGPPADTTISVGFDGGPSPDADDTDAGRPPAPDAVPSAIPASGLGPWTGRDNVPASQSPPGNLRPERVPMFVGMGFDDNPETRGVTWVVDTFSGIKNPAGTGKAATYDGTPARATFYHTSSYVMAAASWKGAYLAGFETGDHTVNHFHGADILGGKNFTEAGWTTEIQGCIDFLIDAAVGMKREEIYGFRTPFLEYNASVFPALKALNFWYDCTIQEGGEPGQDGTNYFWPYTLDSGSPGHAADPPTQVDSWPPGLWEMPAYRVVVPPDADADRYGVPAGLRAKLAKVHPNYFSEADGQITGLDYNLWYDFRVTKAEFLATLKHTLDLRRQGNRAPFLFGMHSAIYTAQTPAGPVASVTERQQAIVEFLGYAVSFPDVRVVATKAVLDWIRNPVPLD
jgi:hypothetical protein